MISLVEAIKTGRLSEFIFEQETNAVEKVSKRQFEAVVKQAVTARPPQDQTSGSRVPGNSSGKKTR